ncbi:MAG: hypothetical protein H6613_12820 [Ignavibacteriales bacterium]|nr:hypothetical protein [Ignavibacteriales bacterium]
MPTNNIRSAQIDNSGDLWISSSNGVSKIEISAGYDNPVIINYDVKDGLQGMNFSMVYLIKILMENYIFQVQKGLTRFCQVKVIVHYHTYH